MPVTELQDLIGDYLNQVIFVEDYVQVGFNGPTLTALTNPIIVHGEQQWQFPGVGSRDALCSLIRQTVSSVEVQEEKHIRMHFESGHILIIPLDYDSRIGPEAAHFFVPGEAFHVW